MPSLTRSRGATYVVQDDELVCPASVMRADGVENAVSRQRGDQLFSKKRKQAAADDGEVKVVDFKKAIELHWRSPAHQFSTSEDYNVVGSENYCCGLESGHGRCAGNKAKVLRSVALDCIEGFLEYGP